MKPDQSDTLAKAQEKAAEREELSAAPSIEAQLAMTERCIFHHGVPKHHGYRTKAGFVCYGHAGEFDDASR